MLGNLKLESFKLTSLSAEQLVSRLISTLIVVAICLLLRWISIRGVGRWKRTSIDTKRKWIVQLKNLTTFLFLLGLATIWASELQNFAISLVAVAAALAIAFKELILCFAGGVYRASSQPFRVGDRIEINGVRGDVIDHDLMSTKLLEIGPGDKIHQLTGRSVVIPNSLFLTHDLINESFKTRYNLHIFEVPAKLTDNLEAIEADLKKAALKACAGYLEDAQKEFRQFSLKEGVEEPDLSPRIYKAFTKPGQLKFVVRIPAPTKRKGKIEQEVINEFLKGDSYKPVKDPK